MPQRAIVFGIRRRAVAADAGFTRSRPRSTLQLDAAIFLPPFTSSTAIALVPAFFALMAARSTAVRRAGRSIRWIGDRCCEAALQVIP
jgi:hypothetical protein